MTDITSQVSAILTNSTVLAANPVARFCYTATAYDNNVAAGVSSYSATNEQNIPLADYTDTDSAVLDSGFRATAASIPRMYINHFMGRLSYNLNKTIDFLNTFYGSYLRDIAQNCNEYSSSTTYQSGDVCFQTIVLEGTLRIYFFQYTAGTAAKNIPPMSTSGVVDTANWTLLIPTTDAAHATGVLPVANGGTGNSTVDTVPTEGSTRMITSGGVKSFIGTQMQRVITRTIDVRDIATIKIANLPASSDVTSDSVLIEIFNDDWLSFSFAKLTIKNRGGLKVQVYESNLSLETNIICATELNGDCGIYLTTTNDYPVWGVNITCVSGAVFDYVENATIPETHVWELNAGTNRTSIFRDMSFATGVLPVANGGTGNSTVDTVPTEGSTKMVTSGGLRTELDKYLPLAGGRTVHNFGEPDGVSVFRDLGASPNDGVESVIVYLTQLTSNVGTAQLKSGFVGDIYVNRGTTAAKLITAQIHINIMVAFTDIIADGYIVGNINYATLGVALHDGVYFLAVKTPVLPTGVFTVDGVCFGAQTLALGNLSGCTFTEYRTISHTNLDGAVIGVLPVANGGTGNNDVDTVPTAGSTKMVTSDGIKNAIDACHIRVSLKHGDTWFSKSWTGLAGLAGGSVWTDGTNIYYSSGTDQYVLDKQTSAWSAKTWTGLAGFSGGGVWTDGTNIYYSAGTDQYVLDKQTSAWSAKTWTGLTELYGNWVWTDGTNIYYSSSTNQYVLDKQTSAWSAKTWTGLAGLAGVDVWTDGTNIYYSAGTNQYVLDKQTSAWSAKTWTGLAGFSGGGVWTDGTNIYYSAGTDQYVLDKQTSAWSAKTWTGLTELYGGGVWTDGTNIYYSSSTNQYVLPAARKNYISQSANPLDADATVRTITNRFVFNNN